ncbi:uncharacterized protein [Antedon mediterranea]|uniref:uncharacterized protein isoform X2 n=1 Tax=Antedon mediterranea TaxID=105859 RepID=UPI003AF6DA18
MERNATRHRSLETKVEEVKEKARELASLPDVDFHQFELQVQSYIGTPDSPGEPIQPLSKSCSSNILDASEPLGPKTVPISDKPIVENDIRINHKKSSLDLKNSLDLSARERRKPTEVRSSIPGPQFVASEPSEISLTDRLNFLLSSESLDDDEHHLTEAYNKVPFVNHGDCQNAINFTSDESGDSLTFRERSSLDDFSDSESPYTNCYGHDSEELTISAKLSQRNRQAQKSRYQQSSFALVTDVNRNPKNKVGIDNEQVKNIPENTRKKKKKKKKSKIAKMDDRSGKTSKVKDDVSTGIVFDVFTQNNVNNKGTNNEQKESFTDETLLTEFGLKKIDNNGVEIGIDAMKHVNNIQPLQNCDSDSDELREIVIDKIPVVNNCTERSSLCRDDTLNRRYDTFQQPPFDYPPNPDKLTKSAMSLIDDKGSKEIEMQIMSSSLETPIQEDPRRKVQTEYYSSTTGNSRDLKSILKSTSSGVCDDNAKIPAASLKGRHDDVRSLSNNHHKLSDELTADTEGNKKKKKSKKKKKKEDDTAEEDSNGREPERKLKSALASRKDTTFDPLLRDYPIDQENEPYLRADDIRNIDIGSKNCRTKKKRETTATPSIITTNRNTHTHGRTQNHENIKKRLQEKCNAKSQSAIDRHNDTNPKMDHIITSRVVTNINENNKKKDEERKSGNDANEFDWIKDPEALCVLGLINNNNKDKKNPKKKRKNVDEKKNMCNEDVTHSDSDVKDLKAKQSDAQKQTGNVIRKSASFDVDENASSSDENNDEKEFQVVESKKKKAAKKRVIFEDKSASFPRNTIPTYPKEKVSSYLACGNLRKCKSEPNNMTLVQDDAEAVCTHFGGAGTSSGSQSSASSISTDPPSSQSYIEMTAVPQPNTEPSPQFEFSYASKVKGASPKNEQTIANKLASEDIDQGQSSQDIDSVVELAGESMPVVQCTEQPNPAKENVNDSLQTTLTLHNEPADMEKVKNSVSPRVLSKNEAEPEIACNPVKKGDKQKDLLVNGINTELIGSMGDKSSKLPGINSDCTGGIGITFGSIVFYNDNSFSLEDDDKAASNSKLSEGVNPGSASPVDKLMASVQNATAYRTQPSKVITCSALENSIVQTEAPKRGRSVREVLSLNNSGLFNHLTIAKFLQKEWQKVLEEDAKNPGRVVYLKTN